MKAKISPEDLSRYTKALAAIRKGAKEGGLARAAKLSAQQRKASAKHAAEARWKKKKPKRSGS